MAAKATYCRPIRRTSNGYFIDRPTTLSSITVVPGTNDVKVQLHDGPSSAAVIYEIEADNGSGSPTLTFDPPMIFKNKIYGTFMTEGVGVGYSATITVLEPAEAA